MYRTLIAIAIVELAALVLVAATAQDPAPAGWPQWGGPERNFRVPAADFPRTWGEDGPALLWRRPLGEGYSAILAGGDRLFTMYRDGDSEVVIALDAATGNTRWQHAYHAPLLHDGYFDVWLNSAGPGPYSQSAPGGGQRVHHRRERAPARARRADGRIAVVAQPGRHVRPGRLQRVRLQSDRPRGKTSSSRWAAAARAWWRSTARPGPWRGAVRRSTSRPDRRC